MPVLLLHVRANVLLIGGVVCAVMAAAFPAIAQPEEATGDEDGPVARVVAALEAGDADALLTEAGERIEIVLFERGGLFSRGQAELVLGGFFRRHPAER